MIAILTFIRKTQDGLHFIGVKELTNINDIHFDKFISGQPICIVIENKKILSLYLINNEGELYQIFGVKDYLFDLNELYDISLMNIEKYNVIKNFLINIFCKLSISELHIFENNLTDLENQVFSNLLHTGLEPSKIKNQMLKIGKKILNEKIFNKYETILLNCKGLNKKLLRKKIDIDLSIYNIKIKSSLI